MTDRMTTEKAIGTKEAAEYIDYAPHTLEQWRSDGCGPEYIKRGRQVRYYPSALDRWLKQTATVVRPRKLIANSTRATPQPHPEASFHHPH